MKGIAELTVFYNEGIGKPGFNQWRACREELFSWCHQDHFVKVRKVVRFEGSIPFRDFTLFPSQKRFPSSSRDMSRNSSNHANTRCHMSRTFAGLFKACPSPQ